eukprot:gb/GEZJ01000412.1/.p1 GENE.gb/GEZJ01000412.1/~~gb/GEZJ01000412.1/.p1  ORF type:complete len:837 (-),score=50.13 gb/GEZJ01000412.1/:129-2639(-)
MSTIAPVVSPASILPSSRIAPPPAAMTTALSSTATAAPPRNRSCCPDPSRLSPHDPPPPQCATDPDPPPSMQYNPFFYRSFTWQFIWNLFMTSPRTRSWLFQNQSPDSAHVIQSLLSNPLLLGYVFGSQTLSQPHEFPDIGDLHTVFTSDNDTLLGFHFGFQGVQPVMPLLFQVAKDPLLANPNVIVRRAAMLRYPPANCFFVIEMNWCQSGLLAVSTSVCPIHPTDSRPAGLTPFFDNAEIRVFERATAERLARTADILETYTPHAATHPADVHLHLSHFFHPPDDCYTFTICEPDDPSYHIRQRPAFNMPQHRDRQKFTVEEELAGLINQTSSKSPKAMSPLPQHCDQGEHISVAEPNTARLWASFQNIVVQSRRLGIFNTIMTKRVGGRFGKCVQLYGREARYTFLSTSGISVRGRVHRLCHQIRINYSGPCTDRYLLQSSGGEHGPAPPDYTFTDGVQGELGGTEYLSDCSVERKRRKVFETSDPFSVRILTVPRPEVVSTPVPKILVGAHNTVLGLCPVGSVSSSRTTKVGTTDCERNDTTHGFSDEQCLAQPCEQPFEDLYKLSVSEPRLIHGSSHKAGMDSLATTTEQLEQWTKSSNVNNASTKVQKNGVVPLKRRRSFDVILAKEESSRLRGNIVPFSVLEPQVSQAAASSANTTTEIILDSVSNGTGTYESHSFGDPCCAESEFTARKSVATIWLCEICGVEIRGKKGNLNRHIANKHEKIRAYACQVASCGKRFQTRLNLVRHEKAVHQGRPFLCQHCPRTFKTDEHLQSHMASAHEGNPVALACEVCGGCFGRRSTLNRHLSKVHKIDRKTLNSIDFSVGPENQL